MRAGEDVLAVWNGAQKQNVPVAHLRIPERLTWLTDLNGAEVAVLSPPDATGKQWVLLRARWRDQSRLEHVPAEWVNMEVVDAMSIVRVTNVTVQDGADVRECLMVMPRFRAVKDRVMREGRIEADFGTAESARNAAVALQDAFPNKHVVLRRGGKEKSASRRRAVSYKMLRPMKVTRGRIISAEPVVIRELQKGEIVEIMEVVNNEPHEPRVRGRLRDTEDDWVSLQATQQDEVFAERIDLVKKAAKEAPSPPPHDEKQPDANWYLNNADPPLPKWLENERGLHAQSLRDDSRCLGESYVQAYWSLDTLHSEFPELLKRRNFARHRVLTLEDVPSDALGVDGELCMVTPSAFGSAFEKFSGGILRHLPRDAEGRWEGVVVYGGAMVAALHPNPPLGEFATADLDVAVICDTPEDFSTRLETIRMAMREVVSGDGDVSAYSSDENVFAYKSEHTVCLSVGKGFRTVEVSRTNYNSRDEVLAAITVDPTTAMYDGKTVWVGWRAVSAFRHGWSLFASGGDGTEKRMSKYAKRGFAAVDLYVYPHAERKLREHVDRLQTDEKDAEFERSLQRAGSGYRVVNKSEAREFRRSNAGRLAHFLLNKGTDSEPPGPDWQIAPMGDQWSGAALRRRFRDFQEKARNWQCSSDPLNVALAKHWRTFVELPAGRLEVEPGPGGGREEPWFEQNSDERQKLYGRLRRELFYDPCWGNAGKPFRWRCEECGAETKHTALRCGGCGQCR
eukprot:Hpha_TRINITY_DN5027_c0_g1::TRINITY_DN5027_c0_g1_i1::g.93926::m.93926